MTPFVTVSPKFMTPFVTVSPKFFLFASNSQTGQIVSRANDHAGYKHHAKPKHLSHRTAIRLPKEYLRTARGAELQRAAAVGQLQTPLASVRPFGAVRVHERE